MVVIFVARSFVKMALRHTPEIDSYKASLQIISTKVLFLLMNRHSGRGSLAGGSAVKIPICLPAELFRSLVSSKTKYLLVLFLL
jgi:hypothetical protein